MPVSYTRLVRTKEHFFNYRERLNLQTLAKKRPTLIIATGVYRVDDTYQSYILSLLFNIHRRKIAKGQKISRLVLIKEYFLLSTKINP